MALPREYCGKLYALVYFCILFDIQSSQFELLLEAKMDYLEVILGRM